MQNKIEIFQSSSGEIEFKGDVQHETVWANLNQIAILFKRDKSVISRHIRNIFKNEELHRSSVVAKIATTAKDGKIYQVEYFNLDMIISIGYRVDSKEATSFRKWSTSILKKYLENGYAINEKKLSDTKDILNDLKQTINFLSDKNIGQEKEILTLLNTYTKTLSLLESYDKNNLIDLDGNNITYVLKYDEVLGVIKELKNNLLNKDEATHLFGSEKEKQLDSIVSNLYQTFGGNDLYPSIEDKASNLLYLIIKDHPFDDGNKRIASFVFIYFLNKCEYLYKHNGEKKINENALVTLTLLIASSNPNEKDILIKLIKHLLFEKPFYKE